MKVCSKCGLEKDENEFYIDNRHKSGLASQCKLCNHSYYHKNKKGYLKVRRAYAITKQGILKKRSSSRKWAEKSREKIIIKERRLRNSLSNCYIKNKLRRKGFKGEILENKELIELQKIIIKTKRLCQSQTSKNSEKV